MNAIDGNLVPQGRLASYFTLPACQERSTFKVLMGRSIIREYMIESTWMFLVSRLA